MSKIRSFLQENLKSSFSTKERKIFILAGIGFFFLFVLFTFLVRTDVLRPFDFNTTVKIQDDIPVGVDPFFSFLSVFGRFETSIITLLLILFIKRKLFGIIAFALFGFAHIVEILGKTTLSQPGPPHMFLRTHELAAEFPGLYIHTDASYPSGHAMRAIFIFVILVFLILKIKKIHANLKYFFLTFWGMYVLLMLVSRVSLGEHWTTDVIGGALLGLSFAFFSLVFL